MCLDVGFWFSRTRAGYSRGDQFYASYPAGTELLVDTTKVCEYYDLVQNFCFFVGLFDIFCILGVESLFSFIFGSYTRLHLEIVLR